jgi:hypothetical protein
LYRLSYCVSLTTISPTVCISLTKPKVVCCIVGAAGAGTASDDMRREIKLRASQLATALVTERHCVKSDAKTVAGGVKFDPRFLAFEFINSLVMRKQQYQLVMRFLKAAAAGDSLCHQMIMGAGKTTVVAPLLALILCDGERLLTQVRAPASSPSPPQAGLGVCDERERMSQGVPGFQRRDQTTPVLWFLYYATPRF